MGYSDELQAVSVDEALIDATSAVAARAQAPEEAIVDDLAALKAATESTNTDGELGLEMLPPPKKRDPAVEIAEKIRDEVRRDTGCEGKLRPLHLLLFHLPYLGRELTSSEHRHITQHPPSQTRHSPGQARWRISPPRSRRPRLPRSA